MQSIAKKRIPSKGTNGTGDRLSDMPDEVIVHILSFMSTLDAVHTMLLRRFGNLWTFVPALKLYFWEFDALVSRTDDEDEPLNIHVIFSRFARFVRNVLMLHKRTTIDTFRLSITEFDYNFEDPRIIDDINMWLRIAIDREVKNLFFLFNCLDVWTPPRCIFTSQSLTKLTLSECKCEEYENQPPVHMGSLRKLSLIHVEGSNEAYNQLISGCPSLQELHIDSVQGLQILNITAPSFSKLYLLMRGFVDHPLTLNCPSMKFLDIEVSGSPSFLYVIDVSSLREVNITELPHECPSGLVKAFVRHFQKVEVFTLSRDAFEQLSSIQNIKFPENRWKRLVLQPWWIHERCLEIIFKLMQSSVYLEELIIDSGKYLRSKSGCDIGCPELSTSCVMPLLKTVSLHGCEKCCTGQLQVIRFLLRNAVILEKMLITFGKKKLIAVEENKFVKEISTFKRASANATVVFAWTSIHRGV